MATATIKTQCASCGKDKATSMCTGCTKYFCFNHLVEHRQQLGKQLDDIENKRNLFRQSLTEQTTNPQKHVLIQQINQWENESIQKIRQTADEARQMLVKHTSEMVNETEIKLAKLTSELKITREENDFNEIDLDQFKQKLKRLEEELDAPTKVSIEQDSSPLINKISVIISSESSLIPCISANARWTQNAITVAGGNGQGGGLNQLSNPCGVYIDDDQTVYVADQCNHRIIAWKNDAKSGIVVAGGNGAGNQNNQLYYPMNLIINKQNDCLIICDKINKRIVQWPRQNGTSGQTIISNVDSYDLKIDTNGYIYVPDYTKHEVRRWKIGDQNGIVVAGGNGAGSRPDQLNCPYHICVDQEHSVYVADSGNHRVVKWMKGAKEGIVVAGGHGQGNGLTQLSCPYGIAVDQLGTVYIVDHGNCRVMRWMKGAREGSVIAGGYGQGRQPNQFDYPINLSFDKHNNLYVADNVNHRIQKFTIESNSTK